MGAGIGDVITWLRQNVGQLIADAGQNAKVIEGWLDQLPATVNAGLTEIGQIATASTRTWKRKAEPGDRGERGASDLGDRTFGSSVPGAPPSGSST